MNFVTGLPEADGKDVICTVIDKLTKERHYASCIATDKGTSTKATADILINYVFRTHDLPISITSDRDPQFVATV